VPVPITPAPLSPDKLLFSRERKVAGYGWVKVLIIAYANDAMQQPI
jgi:hypothetical protein